MTEHFWKNVDRRADTECWHWTGGHNGKGYGRWWHEGRMRSATHVAWWIATGEWPVKGLVMMHSCDNPPCVNPNHLQPGTYRENTQDMLAKGRHARAARGKTMTTEQVRRLFELREAGWTNNRIAEDLGVTVHAVSMRVRRRRYSGGDKVVDLHGRSHGEPESGRAVL